MKIVGTEQAIHDAREKASGYIKYAADYDSPELAHICMIFSPIAHGFVKSVDDSSAMDIPGVYGVFHCFNTTRRKFNRYRTQASQAGTLPDEETAFKRHVRHVGDRVAAVVAKDLEIARRAAARVKIEYEELPAAVTCEEALAGKHLLEGEKAVVDEWDTVFGTLPEGQIVVVDTHNKLSRLHHAAMEPHACVVNYDPYSDTLTIYSPNQAVHGLRTVVADYLEMPYNKVRVIKTTMGGSFGCKQEWFLEPVAALVARTLRRPVKLVYRREDSMISTVVRMAMCCDVRGMYSPDGKILGFDVDLLADAGACFGNSADYVRALYGKFFRLYKVPYLHYHVRTVSTNTPVSGAFRSWSAAEAASFYELNIEQAAVRLGMDPTEIRLANVMHPGDTDPNLNLPIEDFRAAEAILRGRARFEWDKKRAEDADFNQRSQRYRRGTGIGCAAHCNTYFPHHADFASVCLRVNEDGTIQAEVTLHDHGCGTVQAFRMILAEELEIPQEYILLGEGDTAHTPLDYGCFASRSTFVIGKAAWAAAHKLRQTMLDCAAEIEQVPVEDLYFEGAVIYSRTRPELSYTYAQISLASILKLRHEIAVSYDHANNSNPGVMGAHFVHVEVDTYTGKVRVLDYLAVHDIGQAINPAMCAAQIQGAAQMGCGAALHEKIGIDKRGKPTRSLSKYHLCLATDMPNIQVELIQDGKSKEGPYGAKSIGEVSYAPAAAAVCSAVNQALGSDIGTFPMEPAVILKYLEGRGPSCS